MRQHTEEATRCIIATMRKSGRRAIDYKLRFDAAKFIIESGHGKSIQRIAIKGLDSDGRIKAEVNLPKNDEFWNEVVGVLKDAGALTKVNQSESVDAEFEKLEEHSNGKAQE
jgi:hypothetical protein